MKLTFGLSKFKIRIMYKNGNDQSMWFREFTATLNQDNSVHAMKWHTVDQNIKPIHMHVDQIEAIYQTDYRINVFYFIYANTIGAVINCFK